MHRPRTQWNSRFGFLYICVLLYLYWCVHFVHRGACRLIRGSLASMTVSGDPTQLQEQAAELHKAGQLSAAEHAYAAAVQIDPRNAACLHGLGVVTFQLHGPSQAARAISLVKRAVNAAPPVARYRHSLGLLLEKSGQLDAAADALEAACGKDKGSIKYRLDYARVLKALDRPARAAEVYRSIRTALDPGHPGATYKEACAWRLAGRHDLAAAAFKRHLELQPGHAQSLFWYAALTRSSEVASCPADMVAGLFDQYADHFDEHLVQKLGYKTPQLLLDLLLASTTLHRTSTSSSTSSSGSSESSAGSPKWRRCIDLGCGTGLMGPLLQPHVGCLAGVDLSAGMVDKARQRGCYQELAVGELVEHLEGCAAAGASGAADLFVAADVFVYIGDLAPVFKAARDCALPGAHFLFSTEFLPTSPGNNNNNNNNSSSSTSSSDGPNNGQGAAGYQLQATGRFAHSTSYLQHLGESCGWRTLAVQERVVLRYNSGEPIYGNLCVMQLQ